MNELKRIMTSGENVDLILAQLKSYNLRNDIKRIKQQIRSLQSYIQAIEIKYQDENE